MSLSIFSIYYKTGNVLLSPVFPRRGKKSTLVLHNICIRRKKAFFIISLEWKYYKRSYFLIWKSRINLANDESIYLPKWIGRTSQVSRYRRLWRGRRDGGKYSGGNFFNMKKVSGYGIFSDWTGFSGSLSLRCLCSGEIIPISLIYYTVSDVTSHAEIFFFFFFIGIHQK